MSFENRLPGSTALRQTLDCSEYRPSGWVFFRDVFHSRAYSLVLRVSVCVRACARVRMCVRACVRACVRVCVLLVLL